MIKSSDWHLNGKCHAKFPFWNSSLKLHEFSSQHSNDALIWYDKNKLDSHGLESDYKKVPTSWASTSACVPIDLGVFWSISDHLLVEKLILQYIFISRGVAVFDCDSHSPAGSTRGAWGGKTIVLQSILCFCLITSTIDIKRSYPFPSPILRLR